MQFFVRRAVNGGDFFAYPLRVFEQAVQFLLEDVGVRLLIHEHLPGRLKKSRAANLYRPASPRLS
jgi:hypothetical protein